MLTLDSLDSEALALLLEDEGIALDSPRLIQPRPPAAPTIASHAQRRLWFLQQLDPTSPAYNIAAAVRVQGPLDVKALEAAFAELGRRHEALRTTFRQGAEGPMQEIAETFDRPVSLIDLTHLDAVAREARLRVLLEKAAAKPFDLTVAPLARMAVIRLGAAEHVIGLLVHHIIADGWSMGVLVQELGELYAAAVHGRSTLLPDLPIQYADYAWWQAGQRERWSGSLDYWRRQLADSPSVTIPADHPRPAQPSFAGAVHPLTIPPALRKELQALAEAESATLFITLLAAFQLLLGRYAGRRDVVLGAPTAGRKYSELAPLIGFFVNTIALRTRWRPESSFRDLLRQARATALQAFANDEVPFDEVVRAVLPGRELSHHPLFQVMFSVETETTPPLTFGKMMAAGEPVAVHISKFDLTLNLSADGSGGLHGGFEYSTDLFEPETIARMAEHLLRLLEAVVLRPEAPVAHLSFLSDGERRALIDFNPAETKLPEAGLGALFEETARTTPRAVALDFQGEERTYSELLEASSNWAGELRQRGVGLGDRVAICMAPSIEMVVATLAAIQAGATYVPLNPEYPDERIAFLLRETKAAVVFTQKFYAHRFASGSPPALCLDELAPAPAAVGTSPAGPDHAAYIIYTSGSTGEPKGIAVTHRAVTRLVRDTNYIKLGPGDRVALASNFAFDAATFELWGALLNGARLVGVPREVALAPERLAAHLRAKEVSTLFLTTALFNQVVRLEPRACAGLRHLLFGGEAVDAEAVRTLLRTAPPQRLLHVYGPTECTTFATWHEVTRIDDGEPTVPIGLPLANTRAYVLDSQLELTPSGLPGELYLGGPGLAWGYVQRAAQTAAAFLPDPFSGNPGARLYRTGDLVRRRKSGALEYLGRVDDQVKIRGFRIEPGEIAAALRTHPSVADAVVMAVQDEASRRRLAAYVVPAAGMPMSPATLRQHLASRLPDYMVPSLFAEVPRVPLNANGKLDRAALPPPRESEEKSTDDDLPRDDREAAVSRVWQEVLHRDGIGVRRNYFELGGDSITAIQIVSRLKREGWQIAVRDLFEHPTVEGLARRLRRSTTLAAAPRPASPTPPLSPVQRWFFEHHTGDLHHFNQAVLLRSGYPLDTDAIRAALAALHEQHDALRMVYRRGADGAVQQLARNDVPAVPLSELDLRHAPGDEAPQLEAHASALQASIDLASGPLLKAALYRLRDGDELLLAIHHLAVDGVSWRILLEDFETAYRQSVAGMPLDLGPASATFASWAAAQADAAEHATARAEIDYWTAELVRPTATIPRDGESDELRHGGAETAELKFAEAETESLLTETPRAYGTEIGDLLLTALGRALHRWHGGLGTRITLEGHGREALHPELDLTRTVGWFTSIFPFVLTASGQDCGEDLRTVKDSLRAVPHKGARFLALQYGAAEETRRVLAAAAPPRLSFNYLGQFAESSDQGGLFQFAEHSSGSAISPALPRLHDIDVTGLVARGRLLITAHFDPKRHHRGTIEGFLASFREELLALVAHCRAKERPEKTPSDFTTPALFTGPAYAAFVRTNGWSAADLEDVYLLPPMQQGLLFQSVLEEESAAYHVQVSYRIRGELDAECFAESWRQLCERHEISRTAFVHEGLPRPVQVVLRKRGPEIATADLRNLPASEQLARLQELQHADLGRRFDLCRDPLTRVAIVRLGDELTQVVWSYHHIVLDGWSVGVLHRDLIDIYAALSQGRRPALPAVAANREYARWLAGRDADASRQFWSEYLGGFAQPVGLPRFGHSAEAVAAQPATHLLEFSPKASAALSALAAECGVTLNTLFQTAWALLLARYHRSEDVVFGAIASGRPVDLPRAEEMVGLFICAVPVRLRPAASYTFREMLRQAQAAALESEAHHHFPLAEIQALTPLGSALFDHILVFENYPLDETIFDGADGGLRVEAIEAHDRTHYDLDLTISPGRSITVQFAYNRAVYPDAQIGRVAGHLRRLLEQAQAEPSAAIGDFELTTPEESRLVLEEFNAAKAFVPAGWTLLDLLADSATGAHADRAALIDRSGTLTYRELHARANRLARALRRRGVRPETPVGLCVDRSSQMIVGALGIMKAGGAYVPLDPFYPAERLSFMLEDSGARVLVTETALASTFSAHKLDVVLIDGREMESTAEPEEAPDSELRPENLAYIIYTSGSTGRPKGVMIEHRTLVNAAIGWRLGYGLDSMEVRLLQLASLSFDVFAGDLVRALTNCGALVVCDAETRVDLAGLCHLLQEQRITLFESTPGLVLPLMDHVRAEKLALPDLRLIILSSDTLSDTDYRRLVDDFSPAIRIINNYGVTEATIDSCFFEGEPACGTGGSAPIGRPFVNVTMYVLDERLRPCPVGIAGELFIGGGGLARGYFNRPDLTEARFPVVDLCGKPQRLYRSGDLAVWLEDGNLGYLGRNDHQVKVRGFRVELGEIEARLRTHPGVRNVVAAVRQVGGVNDLVAYIVPAGDWTPASWREHVQAALPEYMVPGRWVAIEEVPLSPNGKVDRRLLPTPDTDSAEGCAPLVAARTATEEALTAIWQEVLGSQRIGVHAHFFELGGHSLKAIQVLSRVHQRLGRKISLRDLFSHPTIEGLARLIEAQAPESWQRIEPAPAQETYALSDAQKRLWLADAMGAGNSLNTPEAIAFSGQLDADALEQALWALIERHETLRTAFVVLEGRPRQKVCPPTPLRVTRIDLRHTPDAGARAKEYADRDALEPFDLRQPTPMRASLLLLPGDRGIVLLTTHHIVGDEWSSHVFYKEIAELYGAFSKGLPNPLSPLRLQYKDYAEWQTRQEFEREARYWTERLAGVPEGVALPFDFPAPATRRFLGASELLEFSPDLTAAARAFAQQQGALLSSLLLAVFELTIYRHTGQSDLCLGLSCANRNRPETEGLIGFFVNILPIRVQLRPEMEFAELLSEVVARVTEAIEFQDYPLDRLIQKLNPPRRANRPPLLNIVYGFHDFLDLRLGPGSEGAARHTDDVVVTESAWTFAHENAKFDLTLLVTDHRSHLSVMLEYDRALFRRDTARAYLSTFETLLRSLLQAAEAR